MSFKERASDAVEESVRREPEMGSTSQVGTSQSSTSHVSTSQSRAGQVGTSQGSTGQGSSQDQAASISADNVRKKIECS